MLLFEQIKKKYENKQLRRALLCLNLSPAVRNMFHKFTIDLPMGKLETHIVTSSQLV